MLPEAVGGEQGSAGGGEVKPRRKSAPETEGQGGVAAPKSWQCPERGKGFLRVRLKEWVARSGWGPGFPTPSVCQDCSDSEVSQKYGVSACLLERRATRAEAGA